MIPIPAGLVACLMITSVSMYGIEPTTFGMPAIFPSTSSQLVNGRSSPVSITTSALVARIFPLRSASNPDMTESAMIGAPVPRNTPKIETAVKTVKKAKSAPSSVNRRPAATATMPVVRSRSTTSSG